MGEWVQLKGGICEVNFGYNVKKEVYANSSLDIAKLSKIVDEWGIWHNAKKSRPPSETEICNR